MPNIFKHLISKVKVKWIQGELLKRKNLLNVNNHILFNFVFINSLNLIFLNLNYYKIDNY